MNGFKEWISDNLRYILLALIVLLIMGAAVLGVSIYSKVVNDGRGQKEAAKHTEAVKITETESARETVESEKTTESAEDAQDTETNKNNTEAPVETQKETEPQTESQTEPQTESQTEPPSESETESETEPQPVYLTMQGSCYLRAEPSMEGEIIGEYWTVTTVEFLEDVGGWYKVRVDGMVGYMGARFF